jgi:hypothetical protein
MRAPVQACVLGMLVRVRICVRMAVAVLIKAVCVRTFGLRSGWITQSLEGGYSCIQLLAFGLEHDGHCSLPFFY